MTNQELKIRVVLDTDTAKKQLGDLVNGAGAGSGGAGAGAGGGAGGGSGGGIGRSGGSIGSRLAAGPKLAIDTLRGGLLDPTFQSVGSIADEGLGGYGRSIETALFGTAGAEARASGRTREQIQSMFAMQAGREGQIPAQAFSVRDQLYRWSRDEEVGRTMIETDDRFRQTLEQAAEKIGRATAESVSGSIESAVRNLPVGR